MPRRLPARTGLTPAFQSAPLHSAGAAAPDLEKRKHSPARRLLSLRSVPRLEAAGDSQADSDARRLARFAYHVEANKTEPRPRFPNFAPFGGWHDGTAKCYDARSSLAARLGTWPCFISQTQGVLCVVPPQHRHPLRRTPGAGEPRRLPPAPPSHPAARFTKHNSALCPKKTASLSRSLLFPPSRSAGQCARQARRHPSRHPPATSLN